MTTTQNHSVLDDTRQIWLRLLLASGVLTDSNSPTKLLDVTDVFLEILGCKYAERNILRKDCLQRHYIEVNNNPLNDYND